MTRKSHARWIRVSSRRVIAKAYCNIPWRTWGAIQSVVLQHNNATPHSVRPALCLLQSFYSELVNYWQYTPHFAPSDSSFFRTCEVTHGISPILQRWGRRNNFSWSVANTGPWLVVRRNVETCAEMDKCITVVGEIIFKNKDIWTECLASFNLVIILWLIFIIWGNLNSRWLLVSL